MSDSHGVAHGQRLAQPNPAFQGDHGEPDPQVRQAIAAATDQLGYLRAIVRLCTSRLLMPIVASGDESMAGPDPERHAEMAAVTVASATGERALIAFTGIDSLTGWRADARPVPCTLDDLAATVGETGASHLLLDPAGPVPFELGPELVAELAQGHRLVEVEPGQFGWMFLADES
ncbi:MULTISPECIES: SseB family protein [unclassified Luteococcus]|uniref:SseB family protein n=1 Tax=unclassified Luteococcus TaxID=2639923 RepID=UPI00313F046E